MASSNAQAGPSSASPASNLIRPTYWPLRELLSKAVIIPSLPKVQTLPDAWADRLDPALIVNIVAQAESHYQVTVADPATQVQSNVWLPKHVVPRDIKKAWQMGKVARDQLKKRTRAGEMSMEEVSRADGRDEGLLDLMQRETHPLHKALKERDEVFRHNLEQIRFMSSWADGGPAPGPTQDTAPPLAPPQLPQQAAQSKETLPRVEQAGPSSKPFVSQPPPQLSPKPVREPPADPTSPPASKRARIILAGDAGDESAMLSPANGRRSTRVAERSQTQLEGEEQEPPQPVPSAALAQEAPPPRKESTPPPKRRTRCFVETSPTPMPVEALEAPVPPQATESAPTSVTKAPSADKAEGLIPPDTQAFRPFLSSATGSLLDDEGKAIDGTAARRRSGPSETRQPPATPGTQASSPIRDFTPSQNAQRQRELSNQSPGGRRHQMQPQRAQPALSMSQQAPHQQKLSSPAPQPAHSQPARISEAIDVDAAYGSDSESRSNRVGVPSSDTTIDVIEGRLSVAAMAPGADASETFRTRLEKLLREDKHQQALAFCSSAVAEANTVALAAVLATMDEAKEWEEGSLEPKHEEVLRRAVEEMDIADELMGKVLDFLMRMELRLEGDKECRREGIKSGIKWVEPSCPAWLARRAQPDPRAHTSKLVERLGADAKKFIATVKLVRRKMEGGVDPVSSTPVNRVAAEASASQVTGQKPLQQRIPPPSQGVASLSSASQGLVRDANAPARILVEDSDMAAQPSPEELAVLLQRPHSEHGRSQLVALSKRSAFIPSFLKPEVERFVLHAMRNGGSVAAQQQETNSTSTSAQDVSETQEDGFLRTKALWAFELVRPAHGAASQTQSISPGDKPYVVLLVWPEEGRFEVQRQTEAEVEPRRNDPRTNPWFDCTGQPFIFYEGHPGLRAASNSQSGADAPQAGSASQELEALRAELAEARQAEAKWKAEAKDEGDRAAFMLDLYNQASDAAVQATKEGQAAEEQVAKLRKQVQRGLESLRAFARQPREAAESEVKKLQVEIRMLKALHARTEDASVRRKAALWDAKLARDEDERKTQEAARRKREKLARERAEERQKLLGQLAGDTSARMGVLRDVEMNDAEAVRMSAIATAVDSDDELAALAAESAAAGDDPASLAGGGEGGRTRRARRSAGNAPPAEPRATGKKSAALQDELSELAAEAAEAGAGEDEGAPLGGRRRSRRSAAVAGEQSVAASAPPPLLSAAATSTAVESTLETARAALETQAQQQASTGELEASLAAQLSEQASAAADVAAGELAHELYNFASSSEDTPRGGTPGIGGGITASSTASALSGFARRAISAASFMGSARRRPAASTTEEEPTGSSSDAYVDVNEEVAGGAQQ